MYAALLYSATETCICEADKSTEVICSGILFVEVEQGSFDIHNTVLSLIKKPLRSVGKSCITSSGTDMPKLGILLCSFLTGNSTEISVIQPRKYKIPWH